MAEVGGPSAALGAHIGSNLQSQRSSNDFALAASSMVAALREHAVARFSHDIEAAQHACGHAPQSSVHADRRRLDMGLCPVRPLPDGGIVRLDIPSDLQALAE